MFVRASHLSFATALALAAAAPAFAGELHEVKGSQAKATVGTKGSASVTLTGKNGWHINEEFPIQLKVAPGPGVSVDKPLLGRKDLAESTKELARFEVGFTASEPGAKTIDATAHFAVCQATSCKPVVEKVVLALDVAAAAPPAPPPAPPAEPATKGKGKAKAKPKAATT
jgi:hypothetical protein